MLTFLNSIPVALIVFIILFIAYVRITTYVAMKRFDQEEEEAVEDYWSISLNYTGKEGIEKYEEMNDKLRKISKRREAYLSR